jgi:hypothetical protein
MMSVDFIFAFAFLPLEIRAALLGLLDDKTLMKLWSTSFRWKEQFNTTLRFLVDHRIRICNRCLCLGFDTDFCLHCTFCDLIITRNSATAWSREFHRENQLGSPLQAALFSRHIRVLLNAQTTRKQDRCKIDYASENQIDFVNRKLASNPRAFMPMRYYISGAAFAPRCA